jgi:16S rRNA (adenine(1408)-N(1))-methyltransferase
VTIDLGTGDGRAVLARSAAEPATLAIGIDANAAAMIESSRRAAKPERKGGRTNALFVVAAAETPPPELAGLADELTVTLPWGSLLDGVLGRDERVVTGAASLVAPGGLVRSIVSTTACDGRDLPVLDDSLASAIARAWAGHSLTLEAFRPASTAELAATHSTWARRLGLAANAAVPGGRQPWLIELRRLPSGPSVTFQDWESYLGD